MKHLKAWVQTGGAVWVVSAPFLLFILPLIRGQVIYWGLPSLQFIPWRHYAWQLLRQGVIPLWNPLNGLGAPLLANYQLALFYPPAMPLFLLDEIWGAGGLAWGFTVLVPLHLAWGALGMLRLLRSLGIRQRGQVVAGLAFGLGGYLVARGSFFNMIWAAAWLPWILHGTEMLLKSPSGRQQLHSGLKITLCLAMMLLAGHAQVAWYALLFAGLWLAVRAWQAGKFSGAARGLAIFAACAIIAILLTAIQLLPTFEYLQQSQRSAAYEFETAMVYSFSPLRLLGFLIPDLFGNPGHGDFVGYATYWEDAVYLGLIPFLLALTTLIGLFKVKNKTTTTTLLPICTLLWSTIVIGIVFALGSNTPVFPWLFRNIPTFEMFQAPARWMIWPAVALSILAGIGADHWQQPGKLGRVVLNLAVFGGIILATAAWLGSLALPQLETGLIRGLILFGLTSAVSAFIARRLPTEGKLGQWGVTAGIWIIIELWVAQAFLNPTLPASTFNIAHSQLEQLNKVRSGGRVWVDPAVEYEIKFNQLFDFKNFRNGVNGADLRNSLMPNINLLDSIPLVNNFDPLLPARYAAWMDWMESATPESIARWLAIANVGAEFIIDPLGSGQAVLQPLSAYPRFAWTNCVAYAESPEQAFSLVNAKVESAIAAGCIVVEGTDLSISSGSPGETGKVSIHEDIPGRILLTVNSNVPGWLVIRDSWYPGWQAYIDGELIALYPADYLFKALPLPDGNHQIELEYKPISFTIGLWISLFTWLAFIVVWGILRRKSKPRAATP